MAGDKRLMGIRTSGVAWFQQMPAPEPLVGKSIEVFPALQGGAIGQRLMNYRSPASSGRKLLYFINLPSSLFTFFPRSKGACNRLLFPLP